MMYSSIEEADRSLVIENCYWPLLNLAASGIPLGIEISVLSLEIIHEIDPLWVDSLRQLISAGKVELVGSGYAQIIGPLVPHEVNVWNQKLGMERYKTLLGVQPRIVLVNEMAYSASMIQHYLDVGYQAMIMEWNNPRHYHPEWDNEWRYHQQQAVDHHEQTIGLIWADSIAFQKFQRCVHQESKIDDHINYLKQHDEQYERFFPIYTNDAEIFDYRPNRYKTEATINNIADWEIIREIYTRLQAADWAELVLPSAVVQDTHSSRANNPLSLESPEQPLPVKKQEKYNIIRWALSGRSDLEINTACYCLYDDIHGKQGSTSEHWRKLCYLWSSDFRTHITQDRWLAYQKDLYSKLGRTSKNTALEEIENLIRLELPLHNNDIRIDIGEFYLETANDNVVALFNKRKGLTVKSCNFRKVSPHSLFGTLDHGYYDDIFLGADYYSGHAVIESLGEHKITDLEPVDAIAYGSENRYPYIIFAKAKIDDQFKRTISLGQDSITFHKTIDLSRRSKARIHVLIFTLHEAAWDKESLFFSTQNGHETFESFPLRTTTVDHSQSFSLLITAQDGLGATGGVVEIGDKDKKLIFSHDQKQSALIPYIVFQPIAEDKIFLRLIYSGQEIDETFMENVDPLDHQINAEIQVRAERIYQ